MSVIIDPFEEALDWLGDKVGDIFSGAVDLVEGVIDVVLDAGEWVVDKIVEPVIDGIGDIVDYALDNPIEAVTILATTLLAGPTATVLGTTKTAVLAASTWAIPLATGANTLAKGGELGDAIKAAALAYAGSTVGYAAGTTASAAVTQATGSKVVGQIIGAGSNGAATAIVYGQDPVEAFKNGGITAGVGAAMGAISNKIDTIARDTLGVEEGELTGFEGLDEGVKDSIFASLGAELGGDDLSGATLLAAADPYNVVDKLLDKYANVGITVNDWLKEGTFGNLNDAQIAVLTDAVSNSFTTALYNNPELSGEAFFGTYKDQAFEAAKKIIDEPIFKAIDKFSGAYDDTQASATALQEAEAEVAKNAEKYNKYKDLINDGVAEQDRLYDKYQKALNKYNNNKTEGNANAVNDAAKALDKYAKKFEKNYNDSYLPNLDKFKNKYDNSVNIYNDAQETYQDSVAFVLSDIDNLGDSFKPLYVEMKKTMLI